MARIQFRSRFEFGICLKLGQRPTNSKATSKHDLNNVDWDMKRQHQSIYYPAKDVNVKILKIRTPKKFAVIILKF